MSLKRRYKTGDYCWIDAGIVDSEGKPILSKGCISHAFVLEHHPNKEFYVIEPAEHDEFGMKIRDVYLMADQEGKALPVASL